MDTVEGALGQPGVGFIMAIIIGAVAGWLAEKFTRSDHGLLMNIIMGIIGAVVANFVLRLIGIGPATGWIGNLIAATVGAIIIITIYRAVTGNRSRTY